MNSTNFLARHPLLCSLAVNLFLVVVLFTFISPYFDTNDDVGMMLWSSGVSAVTHAQNHLVFSNILIGKVLVYLYQVNPDWPWYGSYLFFCVFLSHLFFFSLWLKIKPHKGTLLLFILYFILIGCHLYIQLQFTLAAAVLILSGLAPFYGTPSTRWSLKVYLTASALILLGSLIRWDIFIMGLALVTPLLVFPIKKEPKPALKVYATFFGSILLLAAGLKHLDSQTYSNNPAWKDHLTIHPQITKLIDFKVLENLDHSSKQKALTTIGWTENDYLMAKHWFYLDSDIYSFDKIEKLTSKVRNLEKPVPFLLGPKVWVKIIISEFGRGLILFLTVLIFLKRFSPKKVPKNNHLNLVASMGIVTVLIFYLCYFKKPPPERVYYSLLFYLALVSFGQLTPSFQLLQKNVFVRPLSILILFLVLSQGLSSLFHQRNKSSAVQEGNRELHAFVKSLEKTTPNLYVNWGDGFPWEHVKPFENTSYLKNFRTYDLGGSERTPFAKEVLGEFNIKNLYTAIASNPSVYLIIGSKRGEYLKYYLQFMQEHYQKTLSPHKIKSFAGFSLYQFETNNL